MNNEKIIKLREIIDNSKYLVFFGGAGVSTASNIPDFRSSNGIYNESYGTIPIETIISHSFFVAHPDIFYEVYITRPRLRRLRKAPSRQSRSVPFLPARARRAFV